MSRSYRPKRLTMNGPKDSLSYALIKCRIDLPTQPLLSIEVIVMLTWDKTFFYSLGVDTTRLTWEFDLCYFVQALSDREFIFKVEVCHQGFKRLPQTDFEEDDTETNELYLVSRCLDGRIRNLGVIHWCYWGGAGELRWTYEYRSKACE